MTKTVTMSITIQVGNVKNKKIKMSIPSDQFETELKELTNKVVQKTGEMILSEYDRRLRQEEYKEGRVIRTEERTYELQNGTIKYLRKTIRMPVPSW